MDIIATVPEPAAVTLLGVFGAVALLVQVKRVGWLRRNAQRGPKVRSQKPQPAITRSADNLACRPAGRDKSPLGYWKQFARHGQAFYRPSGTLPSKLFTTRPFLLDCTLRITAASTFHIFPSSFFLSAAFHSQPVERCALGLLLAGGDFDQVPKTVTSGRTPPARLGE